MNNYDQIVARHLSEQADHGWCNLTSFAVSRRAHLRQNQTLWDGCRGKLFEVGLPVENTFGSDVVTHQEHVLEL